MGTKKQKTQLLYDAVVDALTNNFHGKYIQSIYNSPLQPKIKALYQQIYHYLHKQLSYTMIRQAKKGIGCSTGCTAQTLHSLHVDWYYNWNSSPKFEVDIQFVPMCFSGKPSRIESISQKNAFLLGFNEPDHSKQSDMTVDEAVQQWKFLQQKTSYIISPALAGNPAKSGSWLEQFIEHKSHVEIDAIAVHWYGGSNPDKFKTRMQQIYAKFKKPLWITQFACQTCSSSAQSPEKFSDAEVIAFMQNVIPWMNNQQWIQRYAWHHSKVGSSALWDLEGKLTVTGTKYSTL